MEKEIEARFLEIDKPALIARLSRDGAVDKGEVRLREVIFYDEQLSWITQGRFVRIRKVSGKNARVTYKQNSTPTIDGAREVEFTVGDASRAKILLEAVGLIAFRYQEKMRHTFVLHDVTVDIDQWPGIPAYVEFEGPSAAAVEHIAVSLGFDWSEAIFHDARDILEGSYNIPLRRLKWFTFDRTARHPR